MSNIIIEVLQEGYHIIFVTKDKHKYYMNVSNIESLPTIEKNIIKLYWNIKNKPYIEIFDNDNRLITTKNVNSYSYKEQSKWFVDERFNVN